MGYYVTLYKNSQLTNGNHKVELEWHVNDCKPQPPHSAYIIYEFYADGHELENILNMFKNIPHKAGYSCRWYGEMAHFIYNNL